MSLEKIISNFSREDEKNITVLDLSVLAIKELKTDFSQFPKIETILLNGNELKCFASLYYLPNLWKLDLSHNRLNRIPTSFPLMYSILGTLNLSHNDLKFSEIVKLRKMKILQLHLLPNRFSSLFYEGERQYTVINASGMLKSLREYRRAILYFFKSVLSLDDQYVTICEKSAASSFFKKDSDLKLTLMEILVISNDSRTFLISEKDKWMKIQEERKSRKREITSSKFLYEDNYQSKKYSALFREKKFDEFNKFCVSTNDASRLSFLISNFAESYGIERHLTFEISEEEENLNKTSEDLFTGPPFYFDLVKQCSMKKRSHFCVYLLCTLHFSINEHMEQDFIYSVLAEVKGYKELSVVHQNVITYEISKLARIAKCGYVVHIKKMSASVGYVYSDHSKKKNSSLFFGILCKMGFSAAHIKNLEGNEEFFSYLMDVGTVKRQKRRGFVPKINSPGEIGMSLGNSIHPTFFYQHSRTPKVFEKVLFQGTYAAILDVIQNGIVVIDMKNEKKQFYAIPFENLVFVPKGSVGYWVCKFHKQKNAQVGKSEKRKKDTKAKVCSVFVKQEPRKKMDFLISSRKKITKEIGGKKKGWTNIHQFVPFEIALIDESFVMKNPTTSKHQKKLEMNTFVTTVPNQKAESEVEDKVDEYGEIVHNFLDDVSGHFERHRAYENLRKSAYQRSVSKWTEKATTSFVVTNPHNNVLKKSNVETQKMGRGKNKVRKSFVSTKDYVQQQNLGANLARKIKTPVLPFFTRRIRKKKKINQYHDLMTKRGKSNPYLQ